MTSNSHTISELNDSGILRQPKWGHLKDLHKAIKLCEEALTATDPTITSLGPNIEVISTPFKSRPQFLDYLSGLNVSFSAKILSFCLEKCIEKFRCPPDFVNVIVFSSSCLLPNFVLLFIDCGKIMLSDH